MAHKRILIVEDEKITALEMAEHLEQLGYQPLGPCATGEEAIASACALHPDAVLMDIALKGPMDGIQTAEAIRSTCPCPIIYVTALSDQATLDRANVTEPFGYILKPINERELHVAIENAIYRAKLEEKLRESEERYRTAIEHSNDGVAITQEGKHVYVNHEFLKMFGYSDPEETLNRSIADAPHIHPDDLERIVEWNRQRLRGETVPLRYEHKAIHKDGRTIYVELSSARIMYQGKAASLSYLKDITERKRAEGALRESEARFKQFFDSVNDGISVRNAETYELLDANQRFCEMYGYTLEELKALPLGSLAANESADKRRRRLGAHYAQVTEGVSRLFQAEGERKDGSTFWVEVNVRRITMGGVECLLAAARDITERKQAEEAMKRSEEAALLLAKETGVIAEIGRIISSSLDIEEVYELFADEVRKLIPFDRIIVNLVNQQEGTLTTAYGAGIEALGREKGVVLPIAGSVTEEMVRTGTPMLFHLESNEEVLDRFPGLVLGFRAGLRSRLSVPLIARGEVIGSLALASKQEKTYGERDIRLAQSVAGQIAGAIANAQLFRERKMAEEKIRASLREKEVLLKEIHHRVKNNLQIVSSLLFLQSSRTEHPEAVSVLRESRNRIRSMALIHERLYASPNLGSIDMGKYTRNLVSDLRRSYGAEDSSVRLTVTVDDIPLGITEAIPCGLIINELVSNALKHAFPKGKEGELTIQLVKGNTNQITLTVSDKGIGFPEHVDFRKSPSLGLTLINSLVEQLNGTIELDRREGTTFTIIFKVSG